MLDKYKEKQLPCLMAIYKSITGRKPFAGLLFLCFFCFFHNAMGQTPTDGLMMGKGKICNALTYSYDSWDHYWEGTLRRNNLNIGKVTTQNVMYMGALGVTKNLNAIVGLPYIWTKASAGTLQGRSGIQDLSLNLKYRVVKVYLPYGALSAFGVLGFSTPLTDYAPDFLPMSIGIQSTTGSLRGTLHYQTPSGLFATLQGGYIRRSNIKIDRNTYYSDRMYYTNEVFVPDAFEFSPRIGYNSLKVIAELYFNKFASIGGNDIRRNDMPFPGNRMEASKIGATLQYRFDFMPGLGLIFAGSHTLKGRNMGQSTSASAGVTYLFQIWKSKDVQNAIN